MYLCEKAQNHTGTFYKQRPYVMCPKAVVFLKTEADLPLILHDYLWVGWLADYLHTICGDPQKCSDEYGNILTPDMFTILRLKNKKWRLFNELTTQRANSKTA